MIKKFLFLNLALLSITIQAQKKIVFESESLFLSTNATTFVSGETLYYSLFCVDAAKHTPSTISKVAYVALIDENQKTIFSHKLFLKEAKANADFFIIPSLPTGNYKLVAYTKWMLNKTKSKWFETDIFIVNPFENVPNSKPQIVVNPGQPDPNPATQNAKDWGSLTLNQKSFKNRSLVTLTLQPNTSTKGNYCVSVRKKETLPTNFKATVIDFSKAEDQSTIDVSGKESLYLPELRGELISGHITTKNKANPIDNRYVSLTIPSNYFKYKMAKTNTEGTFNFIIDSEYYNSEMIVQLIDDNRSDYQIFIDPPVRVTDRINFNTKTALSSNYKSAIEERSVASQIENNYYNQKNDSLADQPPHSLFFEPKATEYYLDNYNRFPTLKETIIEITKELYFTRKKKKTFLNVNDYNPNTEYTEAALILMDGHPILDFDEILNYKAIDIDKIAVVASGYCFANKIFNGLVSISTKKNDYQPKISGDYILKTTIQQPEIAKKYFHIDYAKNNNFERIPDYRNQLFWAPLITADGTPKNISFYTSDSDGTFEVTVEGFTENGDPIYLKDFFEVK